MFVFFVVVLFVVVCALQVLTDSTVPDGSSPGDVVDKDLVIVRFVTYILSVVLYIAFLFLGLAR